MSFHFRWVFPLISDRSVWHNGKYPLTLRKRRVRSLKKLLKRGMGNGEWGMGNGEWGMGNGEWGMENGKWGMGNGKLKMGNEILKMGN